MRLQNDFLMALFLVIAVYMLVKNQNMWSIIFFNLGLSIKVGAVMWLPGYALVLSKKRGILFFVFFVVFTLAF